MTAAWGQTSHPPPVDKIVSDTLPPIRYTGEYNVAPIHFTAGSDLGFFCKKELMIQRALRIPIFFRLGSLEYCNKLEGK